eukprot:CAMPEP_0201919984 /NCGR_PEP_ID=MMETSP0903-20130614/8717_1 /ASSEMBLY_ACC=CAM_ASM_000552 /TAXON_ID=420261 /ORGANISM="Thalassiosira antarctica, Strain CCMP982" /LENGTH=45 /DNA_ID= /DNA_START= /DNA_END= /DNA_ORIENTATION=
MPTARKILVVSAVNVLIYNHPSPGPRITAGEEEDTKPPTQEDEIE